MVITAKKVMFGLGYYVNQSCEVYYAPPSVGEGHYKVGGVCSLSVCLTRQRKGLGSPKLAGSTANG